MTLLRFGPRESAFSTGFGLFSGLFVLAFADGDGVVFACGVILLVVALAMGGVLFVRPHRSYPALQNDLFSFAITPVNLSISLVVCAHLIPSYLYFIAVFWTFVTWVFNIVVFRSRFLNGFLGLYLFAALSLGVALNDNAPFLNGAMVFLTAMTAFVLTFHKRVLTELETEVDTKAREVVEVRDFDRQTGLHNREWFTERLVSAVADARACTVVALDIDQSALLRDRLGEAGVLSLMREVGARLADAGRDRDILAFTGGDRFLMLSRGHLTREQGVRFAERMAGVVSSEHTVDGRTVRVSATAGTACFPEDGQEAEVLLRRAEDTVRLAKREERGRIRSWDRDASESLRRAVELEDELRGALLAQQFVLHYQPKCDRDGKIHSHESLVRWAHPARGLIPPLQFIPVLERMEIIHDVGYWIMDEAVRQTGVWRALGNDKLSVAVNLWARQLLDPALPERIAAILDHHAVPGAGLELEITESLLVHDVEHTRRVLTALRDIGVRNSVDDFGTGYSSLIRLLELPVDVIKIDKSFVDRLGESQQAEAVVRLVLQMARHLGKSTVAEGVETAEQLAFLVAEGCDLFQGYYFSRPLDAKAFEARWVAN